MVHQYVIAFIFGNILFFPITAAPARFPRSDFPPSGRWFEAPHSRFFRPIPGETLQIGAEYGTLVGLAGVFPHIRFYGSPDFILLRAECIRPPPRFLPPVKMLGRAIRRGVDDGPHSDSFLEDIPCLICVLKFPGAVPSPSSSHKSVRFCGSPDFILLRAE